MLTDRHFPYSSMQEINLDWILTKVKNILRFVPDDGAVGQILRRTAHGAEWSNEQGGGAVTSVNGQTGDVILSIPTDTSDLNNDSGFVDAAGAAAAAPVQSVNSQTGAVTLSIPTDTSDLNNDSGFVDAAGAAAAAPVQSVNSQTGAVTLSIPTDVSDLNNDSGFVDAAGAAAAAPVQSVNGQTGAVVTYEQWDQLGSSSVNGNLTLAHSVDDYRYIAWYLIENVYGAVEGFMLVPVSMFKQYSTLTQAIGINAYNSGRQYAYLNYVNDTTANVQISASHSISIWGIT